MKCPSCGREAAEGAADCGNCGIIFSKWAAREAQRQGQPPAGPDASVADAAGASSVPTAPVPPTVPKKSILAPALLAASVVIAVVAWRVARTRAPAVTPAKALQEQVVGSSETQAGVSQEPQDEKGRQEMAERFGFGPANAGGQATRGKPLPSDDEIAASWGMDKKLPGGAQPQFWMDNPRAYAAAQQIDQSEVTKSWAGRMLAVFAGLLAAIAVMVFKRR